MHRPQEANYISRSRYLVHSGSANCKNKNIYTLKCTWYFHGVLNLFIIALGMVLRWSHFIFIRKELLFFIINTVVLTVCNDQRIFQLTYIILHLPGNRCDDILIVLYSVPGTYSYLLSWEHNCLQHK